MIPSARMKRLYHSLIHRWGEPNDLIVFEREKAAVPGALEEIHISIWDPDADCDVTSFFSLGMSEKSMNGADYLAEVTLGCRGILEPDTRSMITALLANIVEYPFTYDLKLDWWERIRNPGPIPGFPSCTQLLVAPDLTDGTFDFFPSPDEDVKVLRIIPITPREGHVLKDHGCDAFLDYWAENEIDIFAPRNDP